MNRSSTISSKYTFLLAILVVSFVGCGPAKNGNEGARLSSSARVVGYLAMGHLDLYENIDYCKLTHLNLSFANPDSLGTIISRPLNKVVDFASRQNPALQILVSVGGGAVKPQIAENWANLIDTAENRPKLIQNLLKFVHDNKLDGVDVDLEWDQVTRGYSAFVIGLGSVLNAENKLMTAALPATTRLPHITDEALRQFDFINIMAYDSTGPWNPDNIGQHSSYQDALDRINFWNHQQHIPATRLNLGLPFYGYDFLEPETVSVPYGTIVKKGNEYADRDNIGLLYYNGRPTIAKKIRLAAQRVHGVMIWELTQDAYDEYSLLDLIHKTYIDLGCMAEGPCR